MQLVGVDVGGTFTDIVYVDTASRRTIVHKVPSTPADPSQAVVSGVLELCAKHEVDPGAIDHLFHGTTVATNAVLEHKGARAGMITTKGYRDILHIGRHQRPKHYSIMQEIPWQDRPLVRREHRKVVTERLVPPKGDVLTPLDEGEVRAAARALREEGVTAVSVCFLFSYLNPAHEQRAAAILREELPDAFICTSSGVSPQFREFERFTTAAMNAFIGPKVKDYIDRLDGEIAKSGMRADLLIMASNGGVATPAMVATHPIATLLSGPAGGVLGGAWIGGIAGRGKLITFDVGGTSADIGVVTDGRYSEATARDTWIAGYPVIVPMLDIHTIGAGGGSIAYVDAGGAFRVGPQSAGAVPGPAAYGRGGTDPTVTDANLVLGRLDAGNFLGGAMSLDPAAAEAAIARLAKQLGIGLFEAAEGVVTILNSNMANAIRSRTVQKGIDPREYALVAFGGAGPLHGAEVAIQLSIPEVLVPPFPGITSAMGLLTTDLKYDSIKTAFQISTAPDCARMNGDFVAMEKSLAGEFKRSGIEPRQVRYARFGDLRYVGQGYELRVPIGDSKVTPDSLQSAYDKFHKLHEAEYGHFFAASPIEIVNIRVTGVAVTPKIGEPAPRSGGSLAEALVTKRKSVFRVDGRLAEVETAVYRRDKLPIDRAIDGPAIILQNDSTTVVPPKARVTADRFGNLLIDVRGLA
jgi:N-methylhydantoinase A